MTHPQEIQDVINSAPDLAVMLGSTPDTGYQTMVAKAKALVKERIEGERIGLPGEMNYLHSFRVHELASKLYPEGKKDPEMFLAALLHDVIEDSPTTFQELAQMGFSKRTIELVYLCTHDEAVPTDLERWVVLMAKLVEARDREAWVIKLCDTADNLSQSRGLSEKNRTFMREAKAPLILRVTKWLEDSYVQTYREHFQEILKSVSLD